MFTTEMQMGPRCAGTAGLLNESDSRTDILPLTGDPMGRQVSEVRVSEMRVVIA